MEFLEIPDDIWISIFEQIDDDPGTLALLVRTCRRFHGLASKLLLRELRWFKPELTLRNIEAWAAVYSALLALPRKITIGVPFEFTHLMRQPLCSFTNLSAEMKLHDLVHTQLLQFTCITELCFDGTVISPYTYTILSQIPTLRTLHLENCNFINLHDSFTARATNNNHIILTHLFDPDTPSQHQQHSIAHSLSLLPITHLSLHRIIVPPEYENVAYHPLCLLTIPTLTSLSITWNSSTAARYAQNRHSLPSLTRLSVLMPLMSRDLLDELATFVHKCDLCPRFKLRIDKHNLSDTQMATVQVPSTGLWKYEGPLVIVAGSATKSPSSSSSSSGGATLTHVKINETLELPPLLDGLEKLPMVMEDLKVQVGKWDIELLFAIKELFKGIKRLEVRYARGGLPENLLVRLGADILFCLPELIEIKLLGPKQLESLDGHPIVDRSSSASSSSAGFVRTNHHNGSTGNGSGTRISSNLASILPYGPISPAFLHDVLMSGSGTGAGSGGGTAGLAGYLDDQSDLDFDYGGNSSAMFLGSGGGAAGGSSSSHFQGNNSQLGWTGGPASLQQYSSMGFGSSSAGPSSSSSSSSGSGLGLSNNNNNNARRSSSTTNPNPVFHTTKSFSSSSWSPSSSSQTSTTPTPTPTPTPSPPLSQTELGDYLIGWSRYCPSLRVVQIDHRWWWERRFVGDAWVLRVVAGLGGGAAGGGGGGGGGEKGKEREY